MRNKGVCFQHDRLRLPLLLWQLCLFHKPHYEPLCLSFFPWIVLSRSLYTSDWAWSLTATPISLQVRLVPWLADNYQPGDSRPILRVERSSTFFFFWVHRVFQDLLKFSEPESPCEAAPGGDSAELLVRSLCVWWCQYCCHPHPLEPSLILWLRGKRGKGLVFRS